MADPNPDALGDDALVAAAWEARNGALCDYSKFAVGAALEDADGRIWTGANVENASYNLGLCAERVALYFALTHGGRGFRRIAVVTGAAAAAPAPPCGACRQALFEFASEATLVLESTDGTRHRHRVRDLLPHAFDARFLGSHATSGDNDRE